MTKTKSAKPKLGRGQPTKYKPEYCDTLVEFFDIEPFSKEVMEESHEYTAAGDEKSSRVKYQMVPNKMPTLFKFARSIDVTHQTLLNWAETHGDFFDALKKAKEMQKEWLIQNGLSNASNPAVTIFTLKNVSDMRDRIEQTSTINHNVFVVPRAIAEKHGLTLPEEKPATVDVTRDVLSIEAPIEPTEIISANGTPS